MTRSSEYAVRALIFLVQHEDRWPIPGREIADGVNIPGKYLQKILGDLSRAGVLESSPGRAGGFRLRRPADRIRLMDVLAPFERFEGGRCPFRHAVCSDRSPCRAHDEWKRVVEAEQRFLREMTISDVARPLEPGPSLAHPRGSVSKRHGRTSAMGHRSAGRRRQVM